MRVSGNGARICSRTQTNIVMATMCQTKGTKRFHIRMNEWQQRSDDYLGISRINGINDEMRALRTQTNTHTETNKNVEKKQVTFSKENHQTYGERLRARTWQTNLKSRGSKSTINRLLHFILHTHRHPYTCTYTERKTRVRISMSNQMK